MNESYACTINAIVDVSCRIQRGDTTFVTGNIATFSCSPSLSCTLGSMLAGADLGGGKGASAPSSNFFYLYVTATIYSMKILFNDVLSFINITNYVYSYIIYRC